MVFAIKAFKDNYIWTFDIGDSSFACVDPGDADPLLEFCQNQQLNLAVILLTHHHSDHIGGVSKLKQAFPKVKIFGPDDRRMEVTDIAFGLVKLGNLEFKVLQTPGHTHSHICYYEPRQQWLFCGDTLFSAGCGRVFDGTMQALFNSLLFLRQLPDKTKVFCAHEYTLANLRFANYIEPNNQAISHYLSELDKQSGHCSLPSSIGKEKLINPFFRFDQLGMSDFIAKHHLSNDPFSVFQALRLAKDDF
jgi:hydroxyacylglutathione hydrolase